MKFLLQNILTVFVFGGIINIEKGYHPSPQKLPFLWSFGDGQPKIVLRINRKVDSLGGYFFFVML